MADTPPNMRAARDGKIAKTLGFGGRAAWVFLALERIAPLILPFLIVVSLFAALSWFGVFRLLGDSGRIALGTAIALLALFSLWPLKAFSLPKRELVLKRLEKDNHLLHRPITTQSDALPDNADPMSRAMWHLHQKRMAEKIAAVDGPRIRTDIPKRDPWALRALVPLVLVTGFAYSFSSGGGRLSDVLHSHSTENLPPARIDAWITPPSYTGIAPIFLTSEINAEKRDFTVPEGSKIKVRIAGGSTESVIWPDATVPPLEPVLASSDAAAAREFEVLVEGNGELLVLADRPEGEQNGLGDDEGVLGRWLITMQDDAAPEIAFADEDGISRAANGAITLRYLMKDDFRVRSARGIISLLDQPEGERDALPLYDAPELALSLPRRNSTDGAAQTTRDLAEHPWAGATVQLQLEAEDDLGQTGLSETRELLLPGRPFSNPLARAIIEQRRLLAMNARERDNLIDIFEVLTLYPEVTVPDAAHYLGLTTIRSRLINARDEEALRSTVDYMWEVARSIEDGDLSAAEKRLQAAQQALRDALERGASDEEIEQLMAELRDAMEEFMREFAERAMQDPNMAQNQPQTQDGRTLDQQTLDEMLKQLEDMAKSGAREQALSMLDQLQQMMNNLQMAQPNQQGQGQQNQAQQQMNELGEILREQQRLMDETMRQNQRGDGGENQEGEGQGQAGEQGEQGGQSGSQGQGGNQQAQQGQQGLQGLAPGQQSLQERLGQFMEGLKGMGIDPGQAFDDAGEAMGEAGDALAGNEGEEALGEQGAAMDALREGAGEMMRQMQEMQQAQNGQQGGQQATPDGQTSRGDRDPLGRPQRSAGPDFGNNVEVPDEIDARRAREILEAIRKRLGDALSPELEKQYLERLLEME